jgi:hypothetical protein
MLEPIVYLAHERPDVEVLWEGVSTRRPSSTTKSRGRDDWGIFPNRPAAATHSMSVVSTCAGYHRRPKAPQEVNWAAALLWLS